MRWSAPRCDACRAVRSAGDGDSCGACRVTICARCLDGTERCPSCQRPFAATRALPWVIERGTLPASPRSPFLGPAIGAILLATVFATLRITGEMDRSAARERSAAEAAAAQADRAARARADATRRQRLARSGAALLATPLADMSCPFAVAPPAPLPQTPVATSASAMEIQLTLLLAVHAGHAEVYPRGGVAVGPIASPIVPGRGEVGRRLILRVDEWIDPILPELPPEGQTTQFLTGQLVGRVLLWDDETETIVCGADVDVRTPALTVQSVRVSEGRSYADDPLARARVELIFEALRAGVRTLRAAGPLP